MTRPVTSRLRVRVQPSAARSEIAGWYGGAVRIRTSAPPKRGKANQAAAEMLAHALDIPRNNVSIVRGHGSRDKVMEIFGIEEPELMRRLAGLIATSAPAAATR